MTFEEVYNRIIPLWGDKIFFLDGVILSDSGFNSLTLINLWNKVEIEVGVENSFDELMVWTMYQVFHSKARQLFEVGVFELSINAVSENEIEERYWRNLNENGWSEELKSYKRNFN